MFPFLVPRLTPRKKSNKTEAIAVSQPKLLSNRSETVDISQVRLRSREKQKTDDGMNTQSSGFKQKERDDHHDCSDENPPKGIFIGPNALHSYITIFLPLLQLNNVFFSSSKIEIS